MATKAAAKSIQNKINELYNDKVAVKRQIERLSNIPGSQDCKELTELILKRDDINNEIAELENQTPKKPTYKDEKIESIRQSIRY